MVTRNLPRLTTHGRGIPMSEPGEEPTEGKVARLFFRRARAVQGDCGAKQGRVTPTIQRHGICVTRPPGARAVRAHDCLIPLLPLRPARHRVP
jgi:hypothetical protein